MNTHAHNSTSTIGPLVAAPTEVEQQGAEFRSFDWSISRRLLGYMWRYPKMQWGIIFLAVIIASINTLAPVVMTETIRRTIEHPEQWTASTGLSPLAGVLIGAGLLAFLAFSYYLIMGERIRSVSRMTERVVYDLRSEIFEHVQRLDMSYFDRTKLGRILSRGTGDVEAVRAAIAEVIPRTLIHSLMMLGLFAVMIIYDWLLALAVLAFAPLLWVANNYFQKRMAWAYRAVQESFSRLTANIAESVSGMRVTQAFARETINDQLFRDLCLLHRRRNMNAARIHGLYIPLFDVTSQLIAVVIIAFGGWRVAEGYMSVSDLIGFLLCTGGFFISIIILAELYNTTLQAMAGGERIFALLDTKPEITDAPDAKPLEPKPRGAHIVFEHVNFSYTPDKPVLNDISFEAAPGQAVALVGHTGSGKTTIVSLIARLYAHNTGRILIDADPIESITLHSLHSQIALVLQDNFLFSGTVMDNIRFGKPDATDEEVFEACRSLGCLDVLERLPDALNTDVGERGSNLSLGQRQLACFARAMISNPRLLMLDEATSAVDTFTEHKIQRALERLMENRTSIIVAHRLSTVRRADLILVIDHARIIERGTHSQLLAQQGHYATLYSEFVRLSTE